MTRPPLTLRALAHAELHPESADIIAELVHRIDAVHRTIRDRLTAGHDYTTDLDPNQGATS